MTIAERKALIFAACGRDAEEAMRTMSQTDAELYAWFVNHATERQYVAEYDRHVRTPKHDVTRTESTDPALFDMPTVPKQRSIRARVVASLDGQRREYDVLQLEGEAGAEVLERIVARDRKPAATVMERCREYEGYAEEMRQAAARGEHLTVAEIIAERGAA